jgi:hypothetical protein
MTDIINHPHHYARWTIEPIEFTMRNNLPFWVGNILKYVMRYDAKDGLQDLRKARSYLDMKIRELEGVERFWEAPATALADIAHLDAPPVTGRTPQDLDTYVRERLAARLKSTENPEQPHE